MEMLRLFHLLVPPSPSSSLEPRICLLEAERKKVVELEGKEKRREEGRVMFSMVLYMYMTFFAYLLFFLDDHERLILFFLQSDRSWAGIYLY